MIANGGIRKALDLTRESAVVRDRFRGIESFLTARRLIEAGAGCVTLSYGGWDTHGQNFTTLARQLPVLDRAMANLIQDLHDRGMARRRGHHRLGRIRPHAAHQRRLPAAITGPRSCRA